MSLPAAFLFKDENIGCRQFCIAFLWRDLTIQDNIYRIVMMKY
jgi:hypothetical protein